MYLITQGKSCKIFPSISSCKEYIKICQKNDSKLYVATIKFDCHKLNTKSFKWASSLLKIAWRSCGLIEMKNLRPQ